MSKYGKWFHPYKPAKEFSKKVAYFSMEIAVDQILKTYSGGLGFLAGSHMRSAFDLKQNMIGVTILWKYGYYDQSRNPDQTLKAQWVEKNYNFLEDTGIEVEVRIKENEHVKVRALVLKPEVFGTIPIYFLTTDVDGNDEMSRSITERLYDSNGVTRVAQSIILGIGGAKVVEALGEADVYHLNEGHALPAFYYLRNKGIGNDRRVFTTHTPEKAGNEEHEADFLNEMGFFDKTLTDGEIKSETDGTTMLSYTVAALRMSRKSNAVSRLHAKVAKDMWKDFKGISEIIPITNAQHQDYWQGPFLKKAWEQKDEKAFWKRKKELKRELFAEVASQTGKIFRDDVLTIVWARRFAGYKRADLLLYDLERLEKILTNEKHPVQIIWAGKPYPLDEGAFGVFNRLVHYTKYRPNCTVLVGYEMALSRLLKRGSDIWLNNPRITREASGTSGMTAAFNGSLNLSTNDGWIPEFEKDGENSFVLPDIDHKLPVEKQDRIDAENLYEIIEKKVLPTYYEDPSRWSSMVFNAMDGVIPEFTSRRMAADYFNKLY